MLFNSHAFIFIFLPFVFLVFVVFRSKAPVWSITWLIFASVFYYGWWKPQFLILLFVSIAINLFFGRILINTYNSLSRSICQVILALGIIFNLGILGYFKYAGFLVFNINALFHTGFPNPNILLPIGISFITFQKISFLIDAYRGHVRNFSTLNYIFFVTFFPQLIAGPIVHHSEIMPQLVTIPDRNLKSDFAVGISIFIFGLFKKIIVADSLATYANAGYAMVAHGQPLDAASAWITVLSYSFQLYYDFSGYSDMAIGVARLFGIHLPLNFYSPYKASSIIDFWRRWHITLSRFLRDYLYIPLGGSQLGAFRRYLNLSIVMLLGGLWHGANWTFVAWGSIHGLLLSINHAWRKLPFKPTSFYFSKFVYPLSVITTFLLVTLAWIPFRAETIQEAGTMLGYLLPNLSGDGAFTSSFLNFWDAQFTQLVFDIEWFKPHELWPVVLPSDYLAITAKPIGFLLVTCILLTFILPNTSEIFSHFNPALGLEGYTKRGSIRCLNTGLAAGLGLMFVCIVLQLAHISPFLYFQF